MMPDKIVTDNLETCIYCENNKDFEIPNRLIKDLISGNVVIFAGAGISTERKYCFQCSFYEDICNSLQISAKDCKLSFSELMSKFVDKTGSKKELLNQILYRIEYTKNFPEIYKKVTEFHRLLGNIPFIQNIITTNWDNFFEDFSDALAIVNDKDFVFTNYDSKRKVYKIHGSIGTPGSIVATTEDYKHCNEALKSGLLGSMLKLLLATKTVVFVGFSFGDEDLDEIFKFIEESMSDCMPTSYIVNPYESSKKIKYKNATLIKTDACYFLNRIIQNLLDEEYLYSNPEIYDKIEDLLKTTRKVHNDISDLYLNEDKLKHRLAYCLIFQDGLIHSFERALANISSGKYLQKKYIEDSIKAYIMLGKHKLDAEHYFDFAYIEGYICGLSIFLCDKNYSNFYVPGYGKHITKQKTYEKIIQKPLVDPFEEYSKKHIEKYPKNLVLHHEPFL